MASEGNPFADLRFEDFRRLATRADLSRHEKVGFPDSYREGREVQIFADIAAKLRAVRASGKTILEIGPGCSDLPLMLADECARNGNRVIFVDSEEMLVQLPDGPHVTKYAGTFPRALGADLERLLGSVDAILAYSVIQYVFVEDNLWHFLDQCLALLREGGEVLFGDIPNVSMRKRFFASPAGVESHRNFTGRDEPPGVRFSTLEPGQMDDSVVMSLLTRARAQGFHGWVVPQADALPMANRREDILLRKP